MSKSVAGIFLLCCFLFSSQSAVAQRIGGQKPRSSRYTINKKYTTVGISLNSINYFGDLAPRDQIFSTNLGLTRVDLGLFVSRRLGPRFSVRGSFNWGRLKGDDFESADPNDESGRFRYVRNLQFRNDIKELSVVGVIDLKENLATYRSRDNINPYVFAGVAVFHHNPKALVPEVDVNNGNAPFPNAGEWVDLLPLQTEGVEYKKIQLAIPFGAGVRFRLNERMDLAFEIGYRYLFFDHIDDVSGNYVDLGTLSSDLARALSDRSREAVAVETGTVRQSGVLPNPIISYVSAGDGNTYTTIAGYGRAASENIRGDDGDRDIYVITGFHLSYVLRSSRFRRAKFR